MVSIIITVYNVADYIETAVLSAVNQTYKDIEILLVEDCSTDNSKEIITNLSEQYDNIRIIQNEENVGAGMSRRIGLAEAKGEFTLLLDGDDWLAEDFVESLITRQLETDADIVSGGMTVIKEDGSYEAECYGDRVVVGGEKLSQHYTQRAVFLNNKIIRRSLHEQRLYCSRRYVEDSPSIGPVLYLANKVAYVNNPGYYYRMRNSSLTHITNNVKENVYLGLASMDIIEFFRDKEEYYRKMFSINLFRSYLSRLLAANPTKEEIEKYKDDWCDFWIYASNHNADKQEVITTPNMFLVDKAKNVAFLNTFNPYLEEIKSVILHNNGYSKQSNTNALFPKYPNINQFLVEDRKLWEETNGAIKTIAIDCSPLANVAYVWNKYIVGNTPHPVFSNWKQQIKSTRDFIVLLQTELSKPISDQIEELRNNIGTRYTIKVDDRVDVNNLKTYLQDLGYEDVDDMFANLSLSLPNDIINAVKHFYNL